MVAIIKKRTLFMVGVLLTTLVGSVSSVVKTNFSKDASLFVDIAHADIDGSGGDAGDAGSGCADAGCSDGCY